MILSKFRNIAVVLITLNTTKPFMLRNINNVDVNDILNTLGIFQNITVEG